MKLLFDQNLSFKLCSRLAGLFPGSSHVRLLGLEKDADRVLWEYAASNDYTLVSMDSDFAELAAFLGSPPKIIWLRSGNQPTASIERTLRDHAEAIANFELGDAACLEIY